MRIYVGNLSYDTSEDGLKALFAQHGEVSDCHMPTDRQTGRPRGFAFIELPDDSQAEAAIEALNGSELDGRTLTVNKARERSDSGGGGGRGGRGGGGGRW